ncbi:MAG: hypothetical protein ABI693_28945 [Bryobacteraceae bacterium]
MALAQHRYVRFEVLALSRRTSEGTSPQKRPGSRVQAPVCLSISRRWRLGIPGNELEIYWNPQPFRRRLDAETQIFKFCYETQMLTVEIHLDIPLHYQVPQLDGMTHPSYHFNAPIRPNAVRRALQAPDTIHLHFSHLRT